MASDEGLIPFVLSRADPLGLQVTQFGWPSEWLPGFVDLEVSIGIRGRRFVGRSTGTGEECAFQVAAAEAIERAITWGNGLKNTNGVAVHVEAELARRNAAHELIERDWFLSHYLTRTPFEPDRAGAAMVPALEAIREKLEARGVRFYRSCARATSDLSAALCVARPPGDFGIVLGMGCAGSASSARTSAFLECLRKIMAFFYDRLPPPLSLDEFLASQSSRPEDHGRLYLEAGMGESFLRLLDAGEPSPGKASLPWSEITTRELEIPFSELDGVPLRAFQAQSPRAQGLFFGKTRKELLSWARLSEVAGRMVREADISPLPHPVN